MFAIVPVVSVMREPTAKLAISVAPTAVLVGMLAPPVNPGNPAEGTRPVVVPGT